MIPIETAAAHALFHIASISGPPTPNSTSLVLANASLGEGVVFYDINYRDTDEPLIFVFDLSQPSGSIVGTIAIFATPAIGRTFAFMALSVAPSVVEQTNQARQKLLSQGFAEAEILPVVHSYPKLGVAGKSSTRHVVVDLASLEEFSPFEPGADEEQGRVTWSYWDEFPQAGGNNVRWKEEDSFITALLAPSLYPNALQPFASFETLGNSIRFNAKNRDAAAANVLSSLKSLRSVVQKAPPATETFSLATPTIGQDTSSYCACASLQMIYEFVYGHRLPQSEIAEVMKTTTVGSTVSNQVLAFKHFFSKDFEVEIDRNPTVETLRSSISSYMPVKSGIKGHARVAAGFQRDVFADPISGKVQLSRNLLMVLDPEPVGQGSVRWDSFDPSELRDFILLRRR